MILETPTSVGWNTRNIHTKERKNLDLVKDMASMRYIGKLCSQTEEGFNVINYDDQFVFVEKRAYNKKIFFTAQVNHQKGSTFVKNIPRARHNEPVCVKAKRREITNYKKYDVVEIVDIEEATNNIISTDWILVEKEKLIVPLNPKMDRGSTGSGLTTAKWVRTSKLEISGDSNLQP